MNLIEPGTLYGERINQIDMRFAKMLRFGRTRTTVGFDVYNLGNSDAGADLQPDLLADDDHVAAAEQRPAAAVREVQRAGRFLATLTKTCDLCGSWESELGVELAGSTVNGST